MQYFTNVAKHLEAISDKARNQGDGKAWDNAKAKASKRHLPRGKVYQRLTQLERTRWWDETKADVKKITDQVGDASEETYEDGPGVDDVSHYD